MNTLYYGDCLTIMREKMQPESIDLVYLDPPFNSKRDYNAIYKDHTGRPLPDQVEAFNDTWLLDADKMRVIKALPVMLREHGIDGQSADFLAGFVRGLTQTQADMAAYLAYMTERLLWVKRVMKPTASIYLHCDPTASHYLKVMMDVVFERRFRNEIVWAYTGPGSPRMRQFNRKHDIVFWYVNGKKWTFNRDEVRMPYKDGKPHTGGFTHKTGSKAGTNMSKKVAESYTGKIPEDWWTDIAIAVRSRTERLGYPTQKPLKLLERIIKASSNKGDVVFDPFCGCATTIEAAERLGRHWVGIDITIHAIRRVARARLQERLHLIEGDDYVIEGVPKTWEGALQLWRQDAYQFQKWCVELVEGFVNVKKTADDGIDGRIYFDMPGEKVLQSMALEVKGGAKVGPADVGYLNSVLQYENIQLAGLITLHEPGAQQARNFQQKMALAGHVQIGEREYPRMQLLTVGEILRGATFDMPSPVGRSESGYASDLWNVGAR